MRGKNRLFLVFFVFLAFYYLPVKGLPFRGPIFEALALTSWYAKKHVLLCLVPAFFIAGAISVFISQASVIKYFGVNASKALAYGVASISGSIMAVCSCTVLPLFSGIYKKGAGLGPAITFLYSGPAINVLAIIMTARILGWQLGLARAVGAILFSILVGLLMHFIFLKEERKRHMNGLFQFSEEKEARPLWKNAVYFAAMIAILVFANWAKPDEAKAGLWAMIFEYKWYIAFIFITALIIMIFKWFKRQELKTWTEASLDFAKQITPLLFAGILIAGLLLGRPGEEGLIPSRFVGALVGGNSLFSNFFASLIGALMYFCTLIEVPIVQGLIGSGMGKGPALALLLAGPALSLPNMLVIRSVIGAKKTVVYVSLVVVMATITGIIFGNIIN